MIWSPSRIAISLTLLLFSSNGLTQVLHLGVVPQQSAKRLAQLWTPVINYLNQKSGLELHFSTAKNIPEFEQRLLQGEYDFAYMNPYHYVVFHQKPGYQAIAKEKDKQIKGIIVVRYDSGINTLDDLKNQTIAFPSPAAFAATILPQAQLKNEGIQYQARYVSSHDSVYLNVQKGFFPAGGGITRTLNNTKPEVNRDLRVLWSTPGHTSHAIAAHPRVSSETITKLQQAMIAMNTDPEGKELLTNLGFKGLELAQDQQWDDIRALNIDLLDSLLE